jgi:hypothetical protein
LVAMGVSTPGENRTFSGIENCIVVYC